MTKRRSAMIFVLFLAAFSLFGCARREAERDLQNGVDAFQQQRWSDAAAFLTLAEEKRPGQVPVLMLRGICWLKLARYTEAAGDFDRVLTFQPENNEARKGRGEAYLGLNRYAEAAEDFSRALTLEPDDVNTRNNRGFALSSLGDFDAALVDFNAALEI